MERILLHICCAPCLIYPLERLREQGYEVMGFFYNPNIHPQEEYEQRRKAVEDFSHVAELEVIYPEYNPEDFLRVIKGNEINPGRCPLCWELRLQATALAAKKMNITNFTSTLLVSPYQDQALLEGIGYHIEEEENVNFYLEDFRTGFRKAHQYARAQGIYCQKYCGCMFSKEERNIKK
ncbi:MAG: epoxyqueuosine reductase QueH [Candidatus Omnitrophica bacterium]|nr:epoxyqueuosine reductase QueH [Candidatus Omnitrophota bacterium]